MYDSTSGKQQLLQPELEAARLGFKQLLRRKRFSPAFIDRNGEELFSTAALEYSRKQAEGTEIENPAGWLIECAWKRTMSLLEAEGRRPRIVSSEKTGPIADATGDPAEVALDEDRSRKVREAVESLSDDERRLLALSYFEGLSVRKAARQLRWHASKAQRTHEAAQEHLHQILGVESSDDLEFEVGLAAFLSLAANRGLHLSPQTGLESLPDTLEMGAKHLWEKLQALSRRFFSGGGGEAAGAAATGGERTLEVCKVLGVCLAGGVAAVGGGHIAGSTSHTGAKAPRHRAETVAARPASSFSEIADEGPATIASSPEPRASSAVSRRNGPSTALEHHVEEHRVSQQFRGFSRAAAEAPASPDSAGSPAPTATASSSAPTSSSSSQAATTETHQANEQFGGFR